MSLAPVPTPEVLWRKPRVLETAALPGQRLGASAGRRPGRRRRGPRQAPPPPEAARSVPATPVGRSTIALAAELDDECELLVTNGVLPAGLATRDRQVGEAGRVPAADSGVHAR